MTKQKTIESLRYNYIKQNQEAEAYKAKIYEHSAKPSLPNLSTQPPPLQHEPTPIQTAPGPSFNYDEYMRDLNDRLQIKTTGQSFPGGGSDFQAYLMREKQEYLKSSNNFDSGAPLALALAKTSDFNPFQSQNSYRFGSPSSLAQMSKGLSDF